MRIRTIKPEFFTHEGLFELEKELKIPIRVAFIGLWCAADREGRFKWEPRRLGISITPYDSLDFSRVLDALVSRGFVVKYRVKGAWFGCIPSWHRHQIINNRERDSELPDVSDNEGFDASSTREERVVDASKEEGKGKVGKGIGKEQAVEVLDYLSQKTGKSFRPVDSNLTPIKARLSESGVDIECVKKMIDRQVDMWKGTKMAEYLRPTTLFGKEKFDGYYSSRELPINSESSNGSQPSLPYVQPRDDCPVNCDMRTPYEIAMENKARREAEEDAPRYVDR